MARAEASTTSQAERIARIYFNEVGATELLTAVEEKDLFRRLGAGEINVREEVIKANLRLVIAVSRQYRGRGLPVLDLVEEGNCGLLKAVERFDVSLGYRFSTYAIWWIRQAIERALANQSRIVRLPSHIRTLIGKMGRTNQALCQKLEREPTDTELASATGMKEEAVRWVREMRNGPLSLDRPVRDGDERTTLADTLVDGASPTPEETYDQDSLQRSTMVAIGKLSDKERSVIILRYGLEGGGPRTLGEVGEEMGLTRERIRQIQNEALRRLRRQMNLMGWGKETL
jgi:RNA polymerase primary sigma factor